MNRRRFVFENGTSFSKPLRRTGAGPVCLEMSILTLQGGSLDVTLLESSEGIDWSEIASWHGTSPGYATSGAVATRYPLLRARLLLEKARVVVAELFLIEAADPAGDSSRERKEEKS